MRDLIERGKELLEQYRRFRQGDTGKATDGGAVEADVLRFLVDNREAVQLPPGRETDVSEWSELRCIYATLLSDISAKLINAFLKPEDRPNNGLSRPALLKCLALIEALSTLRKAYVHIDSKSVRAAQNRIRAEFYHQSSAMSLLDIEACFDRMRISLNYIISLHGCLKNGLPANPSSVNINVMLRADRMSMLFHADIGRLLLLTGKHPTQGHENCRFAYKYYADGVNIFDASQRDGEQPSIEDSLEVVRCHVGVMESLLIDNGRPIDTTKLCDHVIKAIEHYGVAMQACESLEDSGGDTDLRDYSAVIKAELLASMNGLKENARIFDVQQTTVFSDLAQKAIDPDVTSHLLAIAQPMQSKKKKKKRKKKPSKPEELEVSAKERQSAALVTKGIGAKCEARPLEPDIVPKAGGEGPPSLSLQALYLQGQYLVKRYQALMHRHDPARSMELAKKIIPFIRQSRPLIIDGEPEGKDVVRHTELCASYVCLYEALDVRALEGLQEGLGILPSEGPLQPMLKEHLSLSERMQVLRKRIDALTPQSRDSHRHAWSLMQVLSLWIVGVCGQLEHWVECFPALGQSIKTFLRAFEDYKRNARVTKAKVRTRNMQAERERLRAVRSNVAFLVEQTKFMPGECSEMCNQMLGECREIFADTGAVTKMKPAKTTKEVSMPLEPGEQTLFERIAAASNLFKTSSAFALTTVKGAEGSDDVVILKRRIAKLERCLSNVSDADYPPELKRWRNRALSLIRDCIGQLYAQLGKDGALDAIAYYVRAIEDLRASCTKSDRWGSVEDLLRICKLSQRLVLVCLRSVRGDIDNAKHIMGHVVDAVECFSVAKAFVGFVGGMPLEEPFSQPKYTGGMGGRVRQLQNELLACMKDACAYYNRHSLSADDKQVVLMALSKAHIDAELKAVFRREMQPQAECELLPPPSKVGPEDTKTDRLIFDCAIRERVKRYAALTSLETMQKEDDAGFLDSLQPDIELLIRYAKDLLAHEKDTSMSEPGRLVQETWTGLVQNVKVIFPQLRQRNPQKLLATIAQILAQEVYVQLSMIDARLKLCIRNIDELYGFLKKEKSLAQATLKGRVQTAGGSGKQGDLPKKKRKKKEGKVAAQEADDDARSDADECSTHEPALPQPMPPALTVTEIRPEETAPKTAPIRPSPFHFSQFNEYTEKVYSSTDELATSLSELALIVRQATEYLRSHPDETYYRRGLVLAHRAMAILKMRMLEELTRDSGASDAKSRDQIVRLHREVSDHLNTAIELLEFERDHQEHPLKLAETHLQYAHFEMQGISEESKNLLGATVAHFKRALSEYALFLESSHTKDTKTLQDAIGAFAGELCARCKKEGLFSDDLHGFINGVYERLPPSCEALRVKLQAGQEDLKNTPADSAATVSRKKRRKKKKSGGETYSTIARNLEHASSAISPNKATRNATRRLLEDPYVTFAAQRVILPLRAAGHDAVLTGGAALRVVVGLEDPPFDLDFVLTRITVEELSRTFVGAQPVPSMPDLYQWSSFDDRVGAQIHCDLLVSDTAEVSQLITRKRDTDCEFFVSFNEHGLRITSPFGKAVFAKYQMTDPPPIIKLRSSPEEIFGANMPWALKLMRRETHYPLTLPDDAVTWIKVNAARISSAEVVRLHSELKKHFLRGRACANLQRLLEYQLIMPILQKMLPTIFRANALMPIEKTSKCWGWAFAKCRELDAGYAKGFAVRDPGLQPTDLDMYALFLTLVYLQSTENESSLTEQQAVEWAQGLYEDSLFAPVKINNIGRIFHAEVSEYHALENQTDANNGADETVKIGVRH